MHKDKNITLLPLSPTDIRKHFKELAENIKNTPPSNESSHAMPSGIKLKCLGKQCYTEMKVAIAFT